MGPRAKKASVALALGFAVMAACTSEGCRNATQVELVVTYDGPCQDLVTGSVGFIIATDPHIAEGRIDGNIFTTTTTQCTQISEHEARVGTLVVTPNDSTDLASIIVLAGFGKRVEECKAADGYFGCIIARRTFHFVAHIGLSLEIALDPECKNVPCDAVSTCQHKSCVDSNTECDESGCKPPGALDDGGVSTRDAPTSSDAYVQQHDGMVVPPTDAPVDSPIVDAPTDTPPDSASCTGANDQPVSCMTNGGAKSCTMAGTTCCYGFTFGDAGDGGAAGYDCRTSGSCTNPSPNYAVTCRSSANCPVGQSCCYGFSMGTYCSTQCPNAFDAGGMGGTACIDTCECKAGQTCSGTVMIGNSPTQTLSSCQ